MGLFEEEFLEPIARAVRFQKGMTHIPNRPIVLADLGCGPKIRLYSRLVKEGKKIKYYIGLDPLIHAHIKKRYLKNDKVKLVKTPLKTKIPLRSSSVDIVTGFAFLEHIDNPSEMLIESIRILKSGGKAIFTTPSDNSKGILEFLSFKLNLISAREIKEHKNYFNKSTLIELLGGHRGKVEIRHEYFEFGLNNLLVLKKK